MQVYYAHWRGLHVAVKELPREAAERADLLAEVRAVTCLSSGPFLVL